MCGHCACCTLTKPKDSKTLFFCVACQVWLHPHCFEQWHTTTVINSQQKQKKKKKTKLPQAADDTIVDSSWLDYYQDPPPPASHTLDWMEFYLPDSEPPPIVIAAAAAAALPMVAVIAPPAAHHYWWNCLPRYSNHSCPIDTALVALINTLCACQTGRNLLQSNDFNHVSLSSVGAHLLTCLFNIYRCQPHLLPGNIDTARIAIQGQAAFDAHNMHSILAFVVPIITALDFTTARVHCACPFHDLSSVNLEKFSCAQTVPDAHVGALTMAAFAHQAAIVRKKRMIFFTPKDTF